MMNRRRALLGGCSAVAMTAARVNPASANMMLLGAGSAGGGASAPTTIQGTTYWLSEGDSRTSGAGLTGTPPTHLYVNATHAEEPFIVRANNRSVSGSKLSDVVTRGPTNRAFKTNNPGFANYVFSVWVGVNDAGLVDYIGNPSGFLADLAAECDLYRAEDWKVIVCTELPAYSGADATTYATWRASVNAGILTWMGSHADVIADFGGSSIGHDGDQANLTNYQDALHPTDTGHDVLTPIMDAAVKAVAAAADSDPVLSTPTTWSPTLKHTNITLSAGNRTAVNSAPGNFFGQMSVNSHISGKRYFELVTAVGNNLVGGLVPTYRWNGTSNAEADATSAPCLFPYNFFPTQNDTMGCAASWVGMFVYSKFVQVNAGPATFSAGDILMYAIDFDLGNVWIGVNGTWSSGDPSAGTAANYSFPKHWRLSIGSSSTDSSTLTIPGTFNFAAPSGFSPF